jgi:cell shape-determining protein MreD
MFQFKLIKEKILSSLPVLALYILAFNSFEGFKEIENFVLFSFSLQMIIIYIYILKFPDYLGLGHIFLAGMINDVVLGTPLGTSSLSYLMLSFFTSYIKNVTIRSRMTTDWFTFVPAIFLSNLIYFVIINNFSNLSFYYVEILRNSFFTFLFFPIFYYLFSSYQRRFKKD